MIQETVNQFLTLIGRGVTALEKIVEQNERMLAAAPEPEKPKVEETPEPEPAAAPAPAKGGGKGKGKATAAAAPEPEKPKVEETPEPEPAKEEEEESGPSSEDVRNKYLELMKKLGGPKAKELFAEIKGKVGDKSNDDMTPAERQEVIDFFDAAMI